MKITLQTSGDSYIGQDATKQEIIDIIETLKDTQERLQKNEVIEELDEQMKTDILKLDFSNLELKLLPTEEGITILELN